MKQFNENWDGIRRNNINEAKKPVQRYPVPSMSSPQYKASDLSPKNPKFVDVLVKELQRINEYLDPGYDMASDARDDIKTLIANLKKAK
jgi:hypothetical protein